ncbi:hypothetical protein RKD37_003689 [Streptomyces ambofaciens]
MVRVVGAVAHVALGEGVDRPHPLGVAELLGRRIPRDPARQGHLHLRPRHVLPGGLGVVVVHTGEQHLQGDRPGHGHRDAVDHAGRRTAAQLEPAHGQLPGHAAGSEAGDDTLHDPRQQRGHAHQEQDDTAGHQILVEVAVLTAVADHRVEHRQSGQRQDQPPPQPAPGRPSRAHHTERLDDHPAQREQRHQHRRRRDRHRDQQGQQRRGVEITGEHADAEHLGAARELSPDHEERGAENQPEDSAGQGLTGRDAPGHAAVGAHQAQRREPPVPPLAAEPHGGGDEHRDRHEQHHEDDQDQQEQHRVGVLLPGHRVAEPVDALDPALGDLLGEPLRAPVVGEFGRADQPFLRDRADDPVRQPLAQQRAGVRVQQFLQGGGDHHLAHRRELLHARRQRCPRSLGLQGPAPQVVLAEVVVDPGDHERVAGLRHRVGGEGDVGARRLPLVPDVQRARDRRRQQQQRHAESDADRRQHGPGPALAAPGEGEADTQRQVGRPLAHVHTTRSMSLDLPSRTTISRSE